MVWGSWFGVQGLGFMVWDVSKQNGTSVVRINDVSRAEAVGHKVWSRGRAQEDAVWTDGCSQYARDVQKKQDMDRGVCPDVTPHEAIDGPRDVPSRDVARRFQNTSARPRLV